MLVLHVIALSQHSMQLALPSLATIFAHLAAARATLRCQLSGNGGRVQVDGAMIATNKIQIDAVDVVQLRRRLRRSGQRGNQAMTRAWQRWHIVLIRRRHIAGRRGRGRNQRCLWWNAAGRSARRRH